MCKEDFEEALKEVKPAFGAVTETLEAYRLNGIVEYGDNFRHLLSLCKQLVEQAGHQLQSRLFVALNCALFMCITIAAGLPLQAVARLAGPQDHAAVPSRMMWSWSLITWLLSIILALEARYAHISSPARTPPDSD